MKIETCIDSLVAYAMNNGLAEPCDHVLLTTRLLDILRKEDYTFWCDSSERQKRGIKTNRQAMPTGTHPAQSAC